MVEAIEGWGKTEGGGIGIWIRSQELLVQNTRGVRRSDGAQDEGVLVNPGEELVRGTSGITDLSHQPVCQLTLDAQVVLIDVGRLDVNVDEIIA